MARSSSHRGRRTASAPFLLLPLAAALSAIMSSNCEAQNSPVLKVHAYQRQVVGGIPGGGPPGGGAQQTQYLIYLETAPKIELTVEGVWKGGQFHAVETAVKKAPVRFESAVKLADESKSIAVPATSNTVTEIVLKDPVPGRQPDAGAAKILGTSQAAVLLRHQGRDVLVPVDRFEPREPLYLR